ncbi:hypothetical protein MOJ79_06435 [Calidifontimicrobium sp. SYSU G02091]|uniref:glycoside hydrolase family 108 protein n=1 Tax=Calidifontimicrobium sp. SYSU G02091 TaxID=2926421 RepID=UPI001F52E9E0|nr:glycosyl hydrolase 108 family protein [Calidifontimicrobium sp. SYSU G02091]MCI1191476.1 hypothetical protein [Calidifontimicrobium sp. SYSU G02091]
MADFAQAYEAMIRREGGYVLHTVPGDRGGQTYAGISRRAHPQWSGWQSIDAGGTPSADEVRSLYRQQYWRAIFGDLIEHQGVASSIFDFAVNAGVRVAVVLAQTVAGVTPDGVMGPVTLQALNSMRPDDFVARYALAKIARYVAIVKRDKTQAKFLLGWINRALEGVA